MKVGNKNMLIRLMAFVLTISLVTVMILPSFAETGEIDLARGPVVNMYISPTSISICRGQAYQLTAIPQVSGAVSWSSSNSSVATVTQYGLVVGVSAGTAYITAMVDSLEPGINAAQCQVTVSSSGIVANGTYFIRNMNSNKYIDVEGPSTANGAKMQIWELGTVSQHRWMLSLGTDGYYRLKSVYSSKYMRVTGSSAVAGATITQNSSIVSGSKWALLETSAGYYAFVPASSTSSLVVLNVTGTTNGYDLNTATYTANSNYRDEWILQPVSKTISGVPIYLSSNSTHWCIPCAITNVGGYWSTHGYSVFNCSTSTQQETMAADVQLIMNSYAGMDTGCFDNDNIQAGFSFFDGGDMQGNDYRLCATNLWYNNFQLHDIVDEISAGRPVMMGFGGTENETGNPYDGAHMTVCAGYNVSSGVCTVYLSDAWRHDGYQSQTFSTAYNDFISEVEVINFGTN